MRKIAVHQAKEDHTVSMLPACSTAAFSFFRIVFCTVPWWCGNFHANVVWDNWNNLSNRLYRWSCRRTDRPKQTADSSRTDNWSFQDHLVCDRESIHNPDLKKRSIVFQPNVGFLYSLWSPRSCSTISTILNVRKNCKALRLYGLLQNSVFTVQEYHRETPNDDFYQNWTVATKRSVDSG